MANICQHVSKLPLDKSGLFVIICNMTTNSETRKEDMIKLRYVDGWTLQRIGDKYGVSRQRVRQIIGKTGHIAKRDYDILKSDEFLDRTSHLTNDEISRLLNVPYHTVSKFRSKIRHAVSNGDSGPGKGYKVEEIVSKQLEKNGIDNNLMSFAKEFDILAHDIVRIDVKAAFRPLGLSSSKSYRYINPMWSFQIKGSKKKRDTDFYICVIVPDKEFFVIPMDIVPKKQEYIRFCWPTARPEIGKYQKYLDAYHLITEFAEEYKLPQDQEIFMLADN